MSYRERVAAALPAVLVSLTHQHLRENGLDVREDMDVLVTRALKEAVKGLPNEVRDIVLDRAAEEGAVMLRNPNTDTAPQLWVALAHAILVAANRGVYFPENVLLVCSAIETELMEHADEFGGLRKIQRYAALIDNEGWARGWWKAPGEKV